MRSGSCTMCRAGLIWMFIQLTNHSLTVQTAINPRFEEILVEYSVPEIVKTIIKGSIA